MIHIDRIHLKGVRLEVNPQSTNACPYLSGHEYHSPTQSGVLINASFNDTCIIKAQTDRTIWKKERFELFVLKTLVNKQYENIVN